MAGKHQVGAILFLSWCVFCVLGCDNDEVAVYEVKLSMMWSEDSLPKEYFDHFRDGAQWSPVFGQSHNRSYVLYRVGEVPRPAVQHLIQTGSIDDLMLQGDEEPKVYDQFSAPAIDSGVGETKGLVVVDGEHSLISLISRMIPTSSWFVGVDSIDLCIDSSWVDQITLDLEPLSAGITLDNDNWHSTSADPITKLGQKLFSNHAAGFLRSSTEHTIAKVEFTKKEIYPAVDINKLIRNDVIAKLKQKDQNKGLPRRIDNPTYEDDDSHDLTTKSYVEHLMELEEEPFGTPAPNQPENNVIVVTKAPHFALSQDEDAVNAEWMSMDAAVLAVAQGQKLGLNKHLPRHFRSRLHHAVNHRRHRN